MGRLVRLELDSIHGVIHMGRLTNQWAINLDSEMEFSCIWLLPQDKIEHLQALLHSVAVRNESL